ncbi:hypothetical protein BKA70DRAFT_1270371 [Coprinopsis sp. MPI-PUGE-AT-0042]|nr:hypothetical protein BKA70DRAFT_1357232 [Coprinopsis sp. MPI-PUGE-AT-0042]KAH6910435.1 hypothetical protein BKA70DRAFT_1270371 [Coprinopsis sp. MPI-PUGE-AT-0042]
MSQCGRGDTIDEYDAHTEITTGTTPGPGTDGFPSLLWHQVSDGERRHSDIKLNHCAAFPAMLNLQSYFDNIHPEGFTVHLNSYGRTRLYDVWLDYLVLEATNPLLQMGSYGGDVVTRISFRHAYDTPPRVFVALSGLGISGNNRRSHGFTIHIEKKKDVERVAAGKAIGNAQVSWFSYPEGGLEGNGKRKVSNGAQGTVTFTCRFDKPPRVILGLTVLDSGRRDNVRIYLEPENVTREKMDWKAGTWLGTHFDEFAFTYLAIESH